MSKIMSAGLGGVAVGAVAAVGLYLGGVFQSDSPEPRPVSEAAPAAEAHESKGIAPEISLFRMEGDGSALIAGRVAPGGESWIVMDGEDVMSVEAGANGEFAQFLALDPSDQPRVLAIITRDGAGDTRSVQEVVIAPGAEGGDGNLRTALLSSEAGVEVLREASVETPDVEADAAQSIAQVVALDAISYDDQGDVSLSGRAAGEGFVRIYLDDSPVTTSRISDVGHWRSDLPQVDAGTYTLRVDEVGADGTVTSRVETPFQREARSTLADRVVLAEGAGAAVVTVQPGASLWAISRETYGEGILYVRVYEANRAHIRDPDLIYPGQVFALPQ